MPHALLMLSGSVRFIGPGSGFFGRAEIPPGPMAGPGNRWRMVYPIVFMLNRCPARPIHPSVHNMLTVRFSQRKVQYGTGMDETGRDFGDRIPTTEDVLGLFLTHGACEEDGNGTEGVVFSHINRGKLSFSRECASRITF